MSLYVSLLLVVLSYRTSTASDSDICTPTFAGNSANLCNQYGFCSSCVSSECTWCEVTSRCVSVDSKCATHDMFGLTTLDQCTAKYEDDNRERPDIRTTSYSPHISEIMMMYSYYTYHIDDDDDTDLRFDEYNKYDTFTLNEDSIQTFYAELASITAFSCISRAADSWTADKINLNADDWIKEICELFGLPTFHDIIEWIVEIVVSGKAAVDAVNDAVITRLEKAGIDVEAIMDVIEYIEFDGTVKEFIAEYFTDIGHHRVVVGLDDVNEAIVVAFRGTKTWTTWYGYVRQCMVNWDKSSLSDLKKEHDVSLDVKIMETYSNAYDELKEEFYSYVLELIEENPDYDLFITGHSLGGALANVFVLDLFADYYNENTPLDTSKIKVYTYGQPRVGNGGFASLVNEILDYEYYRVVHSRDPVTVLSPWSFGYRQNGIEIHYAEGDYVDGTLCQYRECTVLDPYEDRSCRARYLDINYNNNLNLNDFSYLIIWEVIKLNADLLFMNWTSGYESRFRNSKGDHQDYKALGLLGHCGAFTTSENTVKCTDRSALRDIDTDDYRCINLFGRQIGIRSVTNIISTIFDYGGALDNLNGCGDAGDDMLCCLGTLRSGTVCTETEGKTLTCPQTNIGEYCLSDSDCQDTFLNKAVCIDGICEEGKGLGDKCWLDRQCSGYDGLGAGTACCMFKCKEKQENYAGLHVCPHLCRKKWNSWYGTCAYEYDGTCASVEVNTDECSETENGWNLGILLGDSPKANTDARIMFSYCIDRVCSDWYFLNHCDHDDFEGSCHYQYFIVPNMTQEIESALESADVAIDLEFITCGSKSGDGVQIDQIGIGHEGSLFTLDTFVHGDDAFCRFTGTDKHSFAIDSDKCESVSLSYNLGTTSSIIYSGLMSSSSTDQICDYENKPDCADESSGCQVHAISSQYGAHFVNNPDVVVLEISNRMFWILSGAIVILLLISMNNLQKCRRNKSIQQYHKVNVESSAEDC